MKHAMIFNWVRMPRSEAPERLVEAHAGEAALRGQPTPHLTYWRAIMPQAWDDAQQAHILRAVDGYAYVSWSGPGTGNAGPVRVTGGPESIKRAIESGKIGAGPPPAAGGGRRPPKAGRERAAKVEPLPDRIGLASVPKRLV